MMASIAALNAQSADALEISAASAILFTNSALFILSFLKSNPKHMQKLILIMTSV